MCNSVHVCFLKHLHTETARMKSDEGTEEEGKKRRVNIWKEENNSKKEVPQSY